MVVFAHVRGGFPKRTEELLGTALLDDLDQTGLQLLNRGDVVREDTHLARLGGDVNLDDVMAPVDGLRAAISSRPSLVARGPVRGLNCVASLAESKMERIRVGLRTWCGRVKLSLICDKSAVGSFMPFWRW